MWLGVAISLAGSSALAVTPPSLNRYTAAGARKQYLEIWDAWTREKFVYFGVSTALIIRATYLSSEFREAMILERARQLAPSPEDYDDYVARMRRDLAQQHEVVFAADSGMEGRPLFGTTDERWIVRLEADGVPQQVVRIDRIARPTPVQQALFPQLNIWSDLWVAVFEKTVEKPTTVVFHVGSGYGNAEMIWTAPTPR